MTRRADPDRIYVAQRTGILRRLVDGERVTEAKTEELIAAWEATGRDRRDPRFWDDAWAWIAERRRRPFVRGNSGV